jgi:hypothetical protein
MRMLVLGTAWPIVFGVAGVVLIGILLLVVRGKKGAAPAPPEEAEETPEE